MSEREKTRNIIQSLTYCFTGAPSPSPSPPPMPVESEKEDIATAAMTTQQQSQRPKLGGGAPRHLPKSTPAAGSCPEAAVATHAARASRAC